MKASTIANKSTRHNGLNVVMRTRVPFTEVAHDWRNSCGQCVSFRRILRVCDVGSMSLFAECPCAVQLLLWSLPQLFSVNRIPWTLRCFLVCFSASAPNQKTARSRSGHFRRVLRYVRRESNPSNCLQESLGPAQEQILQAIIRDE